MKESRNSLVIVVTAFVLGTAFLGGHIESSECLQCHEGIEKISQAHEKVACQDCHSDIQEIPHPVPVRQIDCMECHTGMTGVWGGDPHGRARARGNKKAPDCKKCHGTHDLRSWKLKRGQSAEEHRKSLQAFCGTCHGTMKAPERYHLWSSISNAECLKCHADAKAKNTPQINAQVFQGSVHQEQLCTACHRDIVKTPHTPKPNPVDCGMCHLPEFLEHEDSVHGKALAEGIKDAAQCWDCHGAHDVARKNDPRSRVYALNLPDTCGKCHTRSDIAEKYRIPVKNPTALFKMSAHYKALQEGKKAAVCHDCHGVHNILPLDNPKSTIFKGQVPYTCGRCHILEERDYTRSIHWSGYQKGARDAPVCNDCHLEHAILPPSDKSSPVFPSRIPETCARCHESQIITSRYGIQTRTRESYFASYHGLAMKAGKVTAANCASCHRAHEVLPSSDPESSTNPANLAKTCGTCHPGIGQAKELPRIHGNEKGAGLPSKTIGDVVQEWVRRIYITLIIAIIGGMVLHNLAHFRYSARQRKRNHDGV